MYLFSVRLLSVLQVSSFWSFVFFHPCPSWQWPPTSKYFYPRFYPLHLNSWERASISLFNVFSMTGSLTGDWTMDLPHLKPALLLLGYPRRRFTCIYDCSQRLYLMIETPQTYELYNGNVYETTWESSIWWLLVYTFYFYFDFEISNLIFLM